MLKTVAFLFNIINLKWITIFKINFILKRLSYYLITDAPQVHLEMAHGHSTAHESSQSTTDMFLDMFTKKGKFLSRLTSFDSEVKATSSVRTLPRGIRR